MALFDKDNPGKNLMNATLWLESSGDSGGSGGSGGSGCSLRTVIGVLAVIVVICSLLATCISNAM